MLGSDPAFWLQMIIATAVWAVVIFVVVYAAVRLATRDLREALVGDRDRL